MQPHRWQPTRLPSPWDSPGKNTGVVCHFLLQCMKVKSESEVVQSCLTLRNSMDHSLPGSSAHGIFQARVLECGVLAFSVKWVYLSFSPLLLTSLLFTAIFKTSSDSHFDFLNLFFLGMVLTPVSCTISQTSVHSSSGTRLSDLVP